MANNSASRQPAIDRDEEFYPFALLLVDCAYVMFAVTFMFAGYHPAISYVSKGMGIMLVVLYLACRFAYRLRTPPEIWCFALFLGWATVSGQLVAPNPEDCWTYVWLLLQSFALALAVSGFTAAKRSPAVVMLTYILLALMVFALIRLSGTFQGAFDPTQRVRAGATRGSATNPNALAMLMLYGVIGVTYVVGMKRWIKKVWIILVPITGALAFGIVATGSRKWFLGMLVYGMLWLFFCYGKHVFRKITAAPLIAVVLASGIFLTYYVLEGTFLGTRLLSATQSEHLAGGYRENVRYELYRTAFKVISDRPFAGAGLNNFMAVSGSKLYTHSEYMEILSTTGIVGGLLYFPIYFFLVRRLWKIRKLATSPQAQYRSGLFLAAIIVIMLTGLGIPSFTQPQFWVMMATMIGWSHAELAHLVQEQKRSEQNVRYRGIH